MTATYTPLANVTLTASASSVTFSSIPATYRDLVLVVDQVGLSSNSCRIRYNGDTSENYNFVSATGRQDNTVNSNSGTLNYMNTTYWLSTNGVGRQLINHQILDYSATNKHKSVLTRNNVPVSGDFDNGVEMIAGRWANTSAITTLLIFASGGGFAAGSTFNLYGIAA